MDDIIKDLEELEKDEGQATETEETVAPIADAPAAILLWISVPTASPSVRNK